MDDLISIYDRISSQFRFQSPLSRSLQHRIERLTLVITSNVWVCVDLGKQHSRAEVFHLIGIFFHITVAWKMDLFRAVSVEVYFKLPICHEWLLELGPLERSFRIFFLASFFHDAVSASSLSNFGKSHIEQISPSLPSRTLYLAWT